MKQRRFIGLATVAACLIARALWSARTIVEAQPRGKAVYDASCVECHGKVNEMDVVTQKKPMSMGFCLDCHRDPAPNIRPVELVTQLDWKPDRDPREIGQEIIAQKHLEPPTNCSGCHR